MMDFVEKLFETIALNLFGTTAIPFPSEDGSSLMIELKAPWTRLSMKQAILDYGKLDVDQMSERQMKETLLSQSSIDPKGVEKAPRGALIAMLFEEFAEKHLIQPHHIIDHPIETTPLCKPHRDPLLKKEGFVERFESFILAREMCNSYTELNDPELQRELLVAQALKRSAGDLEASPLDEEFIEAVCQGMPPTGGIGIGIDRLIMLFTHAPSIRDILFFPITRPEE
jgi:lysyl-tRNA synthetase class 2